MLVATATWGSIPNWIRTGTVISDVLPVTTLNQTRGEEDCDVEIVLSILSSLPTRWPSASLQIYYCFDCEGAMNWTRLAAVIMKGSCVLLACCFGGMPLALAPQSGTSSKTTPLVLAENEGERRVIRGWPGHPDPRETFILKVDPKNGGSSHLVFMTANLAPGGEIVTHRHPGADEILFLQTGTARVQLGDSVREAHAGTTVFIPAGIWVSVSNIGKRP